MAAIVGRGLAIGLVLASIAGCRETARCPDGMHYTPGSGCEIGAPTPDGGRDSGTVDAFREDAPCSTPYYRDVDMDGHGDPADSTTGCTMPSGYVASDGDCDDTTAEVAPGVAESCNGVDDDCDDATDETVTDTYYADTDMDGHGDPAAPMAACALPAGHVASMDDCDDTTAMRAPGLAETCDALDNDCDAMPDEDFDCVLGTTVSCRTLCGSTGTGPCRDDCFAPNLEPECAPPTEACDGDDDDCDGAIDDMVVRATSAVDVDPDEGTFVRVLPGNGAEWVVVWQEGSNVYARRILATGLPTGSPVMVSGLTTSFDAFVSGGSLYVYSTPFDDLLLDVLRLTDLMVVTDGLPVHRLNNASGVARIRAAPSSTTAAVVAVHASIGGTAGITPILTSFSPPPATAVTTDVPPSIVGAGTTTDFDLTSTIPGATLAFVRGGRVYLQGMNSSGVPGGPPVDVAAGAAPAVGVRPTGSPSVAVAFAGTGGVPQIAVYSFGLGLVAGPTSLGGTVGTPSGVTSMAISAYDPSRDEHRWLVAAFDASGRARVFDVYRNLSAIGSHGTTLGGATTPQGIALTATRAGDAMIAATRDAGSTQIFRYGCP